MRPAILSFVFVVTVTIFPVRVSAGETIGCDSTGRGSAGWISVEGTDPTPAVAIPAFMKNAKKAKTQIALDVNGNTQAGGIVEIGDEVLVNVSVVDHDSAFVVCGDTDGDGISGAVFVQFSAHNVRTGETLLVFVIPDETDIDDLTQHPVTIVAGVNTWTGWSEFYRSF